MVAVDSFSGRFRWRGFGYLDRSSGKSLSFPFQSVSVFRVADVACIFFARIVFMARANSGSFHAGQFRFFVSLDFAQFAMRVLIFLSFV